jgi:hypothetical protein
MFETTLLRLREDHGLMADSQVNYMQTRFSEQVRLPLFRIWSGRLEVGAFDDDRAMDNTLLGPDRAWGLSISSSFLPIHRGRMSPMDDESYGMMLSLHLKAQGEWGPHIHGWRCLGWAVGVGRGCRLD